VSASRDLPLMKGIFCAGVRVILPNCPSAHPLAVSASTTGTEGNRACTRFGRRDVSCRTRITSKRCFVRLLPAS
jgi:hypothetical protein